MATRNARSVRSARTVRNAAPAPAPAPAPRSNVKLTPDHLREIAGFVAPMVVTLLRAELAVAQARVAPAAKPAAAAAPAAKVAPAAKPQPAPRKPARKPAAKPESDPSDEPRSAAEFGALSERFARALGKAASAAWADISGLRWDWTLETDKPNTVRLAISGEHAERASQWASRWLDVQPEVRAYVHLGRVQSGRYELSVALRSAAVVPWD